jgi:hypothetical protein
MYMRAKAGIFIIIFLLFLVGMVEAVGIPDTVTVASDKPWILANNVDQSTITISVSNNTPGFSGFISNVPLTLTVDPLYGTLNPITVTTDASGMATSTFKVKTKSGQAQIIAAINGNGLSGSTIQNIDHEVPATAILQYPLEGEVASVVTLNVSVIDRWGNLIDGRNPSQIHSVSLRIDGPANDCGFKDGSVYTQLLTRNLDINGNLSIQVRLSNKTGDHNIQIASPFTLAKIIGIATGVPSSMTGTISNGGALPADGINFFVLEYFLYDNYGNPVQNRSIWVKTNLTDELTPKLYTTNTRGQIQITYGPKISILTSEIIANSSDAPSVSNVLIARFISSTPTNMVLAATPQTMGSRDVAPAEKSFITATVIDAFGNPVANEIVTFSLGSINIGTYNQTNPPSLSATTATTDNFGNAIVYFYPGSFAFNRTDPGYDGHATGTAVITATWKTVSQPVTVTWKNYPYLSVEASASKSNLKLNDTVDITIDVTGNGYRMGGAPITAVLDQDTSANFYNGHGGQDFQKTINAAKAFVDTCIQGQDYVGVTTYSDTTDEIQLAPTASLPLVKFKLDNLTKGSNAQLFNASISHAIDNMTQTQYSRPQDVIRAVIVLVDQGGTTLSDQSITNLQTQAAGTTPFTYLFVVFYDDAGGGTKCNGAAYDTAIKIPNGPNQFRCIGTEADLIATYRNFSEVLHSRAGVNATLLLNFQNVEVNGNQTTGNNVSVYVPVPDSNLPSPGFANLITTPTDRDSVSGRTRIMWQNSSYSVINQSNEWITGISPFGNSHPPNQLYFPVGTIKILEKWNTTYRLQMVNETGLINLFNCSMSSSALSFDDGSGISQPPMCLPNLYITVNQNFTPLGLQSGTLDVSYLKTTTSTSLDSIPFQWNLTYTGISTATEIISYSYNNGPWVVLDTRTNGPIPETTHYSQLNIQGVKSGSYRIKVHADTPDAGSDEMIIGTPAIGSRNETLLLQ